MSLLERAITAVAPQWAARRAHARRAVEILNAGYSQHGASRSKKSLQGWITETGGPDSDIVDNLELLRERSRDLYMGEGIARGALRTIRTNEIGPGLRLNAAIDAKFLGLTPEQQTEWEDRVEREFSLWAGTTACDAARRCTFGELQALARLSQLMSGDCFAVLPMIDRGDRYDLRVQLLEADRIEDPPVKPANVDILGGVEVGSYGEPVAYYVANKHPGDRLRNLRVVPDTHVRLPAFGAKTGRRLVLHLMESERPGQRRGVPILAPVIEKLKQLSRYSEAELMAAVVSGFFTVAITSEAPDRMIGTTISDATDAAPPVDASTYKLGNGTMFGLAPGEKVESINPARPNAGFDPFVIAVCRQIGAGLGLPYELLVLHFTSSYSASRAALLEAWKHFSTGRTLHAQNFCQPVYEAWLTEAVARGYIDAPGFFTDPVARAAWCGAEWVGPAQGQLDPTKEVEAAAKRVAEGFSTRTKETRELTGGDFSDFNALRGREEEARRAVGLGAVATPPTTPTPDTAQPQENAA